MPDVWVSNELFEQLEARRVQPLEIVQEQRQRVFLPSKRAKEPREERFKSDLRFMRREFRHERLLANNKLQFGNQIYHQLTVCADSFPDRISPMADFLFALTQDLAHKPLEGLPKGCVWDIPLLLVELPRNKNAARQRDHLVQLVDDRGFADSRVTRHEHQLRYAASDDPVEGAKKDCALRVTPIQLLRDQKPVWYILGAQRKRLDTF